MSLKGTHKPQEAQPGRLMLRGHGVRRAQEGLRMGAGVCQVCRNIRSMKRSVWQEMALFGGGVDN